MKWTTLFVAVATLLVPWAAMGAGDCKPAKCSEQISVYVSPSSLSRVPKAELDGVRAAVEEAVNDYAGVKPGWKCVCKVHEGGGSKCEGFPMKLNVSTNGTAIDTQLSASQDVWKVISSSHANADAQSLNDTAILAVSETLEKVHPCGGWNGQLSYVLEVNAPDVHDRLRSYSGHGRYVTTVVLTNGVATVTRSANVKSDLEMQQQARRGGAITLIKSDSITVEGSIPESSSAAIVDIAIDRNRGTYQIFPTWKEEAVGKIHRVACHREEPCTNLDVDFGADQMRLEAITGKLDDPDHLQGSNPPQISSVSRDYITGQQTLTVNWDLRYSKSDTH